jgi:hypothetical protein
MAGMDTLAITAEPNRKNFERLVRSLKSLKQDFARFGENNGPLGVCLVHFPHTRTSNKGQLENPANWPQGFANGPLWAIAFKGDPDPATYVTRRFRLACSDGAAKRFGELCDEAVLLLADSAPRLLQVTSLPSWLVAAIGECRNSFSRHAIWPSLVFELALQRKEGSRLRVDGPFQWPDATGTLFKVYGRPASDKTRWAAILQDATLASQLALDDILVDLEPAFLTLTGSLAATHQPAGHSQIIENAANEKSEVSEVALEAFAQMIEEYKRDCGRAKRRFHIADFAAAKGFNLDEVERLRERHRGRLRRRKEKKAKARAK